MSSETVASAQAIRVSVVIPAFGRADLLVKAVRSIFLQDFPADSYELIVVDSSPDENNARLLEDMQREATCRMRVMRKAPEGPGPSRNLGAVTGVGEYIAFMDSDCEAAPDWLRKGLAAFSAEVGLVQGRTAPEPDGQPGIFTHHIAVDSESYLYECANMFYRREVFEAAGGFTRDLDPTSDQPVGGEDLLLGWRAKRLGWHSRFADDAVVFHAVRPLKMSRWMIIKGLVVFPMAVREVPELRRLLFYARYFYDKSQALFCLALLGVVTAFIHPALLLLCIPYIHHRVAQPSKTFKGPLRVLRLAVYLPRDTISFFILAAASVWYRSLLL